MLVSSEVFRLCGYCGLAPKKFWKVWDYLLNEVIPAQERKTKIPKPLSGVVNRTEFGRALGVATHLFTRINQHHDEVTLIPNPWVDRPKEIGVYWMRVIEEVPGYSPGIYAVSARYGQDDEFCRLFSLLNTPIPLEISKSSLVRFQKIDVPKVADRQNNEDRS